MLCWLLNVDEKITCLQQSALLFAEHGEHLPFFIMLLCFLTLLCSILLLPISSFKFFYVWKLLHPFECFFIEKMSQCLRATLIIFGRVQLYVNTSGVFFLLEWCCLVLSKVLSCPFFLLLLYVYLLAVVGNLDWQTSVWAPRNSGWSHLT